MDQMDTANEKYKINHISLEKAEQSMPETENPLPDDINNDEKKQKLSQVKKAWIVEILKLQKKLLEASKVQKQQLERLQVLTKESQKSCRRDKFLIKKLCDMNKALIRRNKLLDKRNKMLIKLKFKR